MLDAEEKLGVDQESLECDLDAVVEVSVHSAFVVEGQKHLDVCGHRWTPVGTSSKGGENFAGACTLVNVFHRLTHKQPASAWQCRGATGLVGADDFDAGHGWIAVLHFVLPVGV